MRTLLAATLMAGVMAVSTGEAKTVPVPPCDGCSMVLALTDRIADAVADRTMELTKFGFTFDRDTIVRQAEKDNPLSQFRMVSRDANDKIRCVVAAGIPDDGGLPGWKKIFTTATFRGKEYPRLSSRISSGSC